MTNQELDAIRERYKKEDNCYGCCEYEQVTSDFRALLTEIDRLQAERDAVEKYLKKLGCLTCCGCETEPAGESINNCSAWVWQGIERGTGDE